MPMMGQYSGRLTSIAPVAAASATSRRALAMFSATSGVETIWIAATVVMFAPYWVLAAAGSGVEWSSLLITGAFHGPVICIW